MIYAIVALLQPQPFPSPFVRTATAECQILSGELGKKIVPAQAIASELLYVDRRDAPANVELQAVLTALHASALPTNGGVEIKRTSLDLSNLRARRAEVRVEWIERWMQRIQKFKSSNIRSATDAASILHVAEAEGKSISDYALRKSQDHLNFALSPEQLLPNEALVEGVMKRLGLKELASIPTGESELWETDPIAPEAKALPDASDLLQTFNDAEKGLAKTAIDASKLSYLALLGMQALWPPHPTSVDRLRLRASAQENCIEVRVEGADATGKVAMTGYFLARPVDEVLTPTDLAHRLENQHESKPVELTPREIRMFELSADAEHGALSPALLNPDKFEPLAYLPARTVRSWADEHPLGAFVAAMPDSFDARSREAIKGTTLDLRLFEAMNEYGAPGEEVAGSGYWVWRPIDPEAEEGERADRRVLKGFIHDAAEGIFVDSHERGSAMHAANGSISGLSFRYCYSLFHRAIRRWQRDSNLPPQTLFLLGGIDSNGWEKLQSGTPLTARELGVEEDLRRAIAGDGLPLQRCSPLTPEIARHASDLMAGAGVGDIRFTIRPDRTTLMRFWADGDKEPTRWQPLRLDYLGTRGRCQATIDQQTGQITLTTDRDAYDASMQRWNFRFANLDAGTLVIAFPHGGLCEIPLAGEAADPSPASKYQDLPDLTRTAMWAAAQKSAIEVQTRTRDALKSLSGGK